LFGNTKKRSFLSESLNMKKRWGGVGGKARQGKARQGKARQGKARQGKARQGKARQGKARQGKARQGNYGLFFSLLI
jgi:hypothetical protein